MTTPSLDLVVKNVRVIRPRQPTVERLDVGVKDGRFARIAPDIPAGDAREVRDGRGLLGFPGVVDAHTHVGIYAPAFGRRGERKPGGRRGRRDGHAHLLPHGTVLPESRGGPYAEFYPEVLRLSEGHYWVDYGYHLAPIQASHLGEMEALAVEHGVPSFKIFMFYGDYGLHGKAGPRGAAGLPHARRGRALRPRPLRVRAAGAAAVRDRHPRLGDHVSVSLHCEIADILNAYTRIVQQDPSPHRAPRVQRRPAAALRGARGVDRGLPRPRGGVPQRQPAPPLVPEGARGGAPHAGHPAPTWIFRCEVTAGHLLLDYDTPAGPHAKVNPPIRSREDVEFLWRSRARREGGLGGERPRVLRHRDEARPEPARATCSSPRPASGAPSTSSRACSARAPGAACRPAAWRSCSPGIRRGGSGSGGRAMLPPATTPTWCSSTPTGPVTIRAADSPSAQGYTPFEGLALRGQVTTTFLRGQVVYDQGESWGPRAGSTSGGRRRVPERAARMHAARDRT